MHGVKNIKVSSMILRVVFYLIFCFIFCSCVNEDGVSLRYYDDCKEYYDVLGVYHKECDNINNILDE